jgi:hypothetical protein
MAALMLLGCILIGYALPTALFFVLFLRKAQLVIVMLARSVDARSLTAHCTEFSSQRGTGWFADRCFGLGCLCLRAHVCRSLFSAFFWLMSMTLTSLIWSAIPPLHAHSSPGWVIVPVGVVLAEVARAAFIRFYFRCERSFSVVSINAIVFPLVDFWSGIAAGVGYGATQSLVYYGPVVARAMGPGTLYAPHCAAFSTLVSAAANAALFNALHVPLMVLAFDAYRLMSPPRIVAVVVLHMAAACLVRQRSALTHPLHRARKFQRWQRCVDAPSPAVCSHELLVPVPVPLSLILSLCSALPPDDPQQCRRRLRDLPSVDRAGGAADLPLCCLHHAPMGLSKLQGATGSSGLTSVLALFNLGVLRHSLLCAFVSYLALSLRLRLHSLIH